MRDEMQPTTVQFADMCFTREQHIYSAMKSLGGKGVSTYYGAYHCSIDARNVPLLLIELFQGVPLVLPESNCLNSVPYNALHGCGVWHRDVRGTNILQLQQDNVKVCVIDFDLSELKVRTYAGDQELQGSGDLTALLSQIRSEFRDTRT